MLIRHITNSLLILFLQCKFSLAENLTSLGERPDWNKLKPYQYSISKSEFLNLLNTVYAPGNTYKSTIEIKEGHALIKKNHGKEDAYKLSFASEGSSSMLMLRYWRPKEQITDRTKEKPFNGLRIAIDPGHLGGRYAEMEERNFKIKEEDAYINEGDLTLKVARILKQSLQKYGAEVSLIRNSDEPLTNERPESLMKVARKVLMKRRIAKNQSIEIEEEEVENFSELLFYRVAEITARADEVNEYLRPDIILCLHFNAAPWPDPENQSLVETNHFHTLLNGAYSQIELEYDDVRLEMLLRLLQRIHDEEVKVSAAVTKAVLKGNRLPPFMYTGKNAVNISENPYLWGRNLIANRKYLCPVVYLEPYCMNNKDVYARVQAGDYKGTKKINGKKFKSIYREYADSVLEGLLDYYKANLDSSN